MNLSETGHKQKSLEMLKQIIKTDGHNGHALYLYAKGLYFAGQADSALNYLERSARYINTLESTRLFARIYEEKGDLQNAERYYLRAVYMVPNRFQSRYDLMQFYMANADKTRAAFWANSILKLPEKIPSQRTKRIKEEADSLYHQLY